MSVLLFPNCASVPFIGVNHMVKIVQSEGLRKVLADLVAYIEDDFRRWEDFERVPRVASHSAKGVIELMPTSDGRMYGFKYVNGHPKNTLSGLQTVAAFGLLASVNTGYPLLLSEMTILTALRTAATSALAAKYLAPTNSQVMAIIGNGAQCEFQAIAFQEMIGIREVRLYDIDKAATRKASLNLKNSGLKVVSCSSAEEAVSGADIITTCTADKQCATILNDNMVGAGTHINAIGGDCPGKTELQRDVLLRSEIFVEHAPQTRIEGEIQQLTVDHPVKELWQVVAGQSPGRTSDFQITLFDSVGFAIEDFSALRYVKDQALQTGNYLDLDMLAAPNEPRDLFGMVIPDSV